MTIKSQDIKKSITSYLSAVNTAKRLQGDHINLIDELLLQDWEDAMACSEVAEKILQFLDEVMPPLCRRSVSAVNLIETLRKVCLLAELSYRMRCEIDPRASKVDH